MKDKISYSLGKVLETKEISLNSFNDLRNLLPLLERLSLTASKQTHYDKLEEWETKVYEYIREKLSKYGFVNGEPEKNRENPEAIFWFNVYSLMSNITYSKNLETEVEARKSSAYERNQALIKDIEILISVYEENTNQSCILYSVTPDCGAGIKDDVKEIAISNSYSKLVDYAKRKGYKFEGTSPCETYYKIEKSKLMIL